MFRNELIEKVIEKIMDETGYCGSCPCGCTPYIRFICLGGSLQSINNYIKEHPEILEEDDYYEY